MKTSTMMWMHWWGYTGPRARVAAAGALRKAYARINGRNGSKRCPSCRLSIRPDQATFIYRGETYHRECSVFSGNSSHTQ